MLISIFYSNPSSLQLFLKMIKRHVSTTTFSRFLLETWLLLDTNKNNFFYRFVSRYRNLKFRNDFFITESITNNTWLDNCSNSYDSQWTEYSVCQPFQNNGRKCVHYFAEFVSLSLDVIFRWICDIVHNIESLTWWVYDGKLKWMQWFFYSNVINLNNFLTAQSGYLIEYVRIKINFKKVWTTMYLE